MQEHKSAWEVKVLTLFPQLFPGPLATSVIGRALTQGYWNLLVKNLRQYAGDQHKTVDDAPYGGGGGMILRPDILGKAIEDFFIPSQDRPLIYLSPRGQLFNQEIARELSGYSGINIICGRFEGMDERVLKAYSMREISIGDYVLSSGDIAAIPVIDACVRLIPGALFAGPGLSEETFGNHPDYQSLLEYPHYTRPQSWLGYQVPEVLLSGNHQAIASWRLAQAKKITQNSRPDLWNHYINRRKA